MPLSLSHLSVLSILPHCAVKYLKQLNKACLACAWIAAHCMLG